MELKASNIWLNDWAGIAVSKCKIKIHNKSNRIDRGYGLQPLFLLFESPCMRGLKL